MCTIKVLVVDDDETICSLLVASFEDQGFQAQSVNSGEAALNAIENNDYQIIITDLQMGGIDGYEVTRYIKQHSPYVKVIMITGSSYQNTKDEAYKNGVDAYFEKPFDLEKLIAKAMSETINQDCSCSQDLVSTSALEA